MSLDPPDPQIVLKVTPPRLTKSALMRERLSIGGSMFRDRAIIEITAPSGFGKTTLLGQWRREALNQGSLVAWLTLDEQDNSMRFAQGIAYAMRLASGRPGFDRIMAQPARKDETGLEGLTLWLAEVTFLGAVTTLILDEVQSAPIELVNKSILYLLLNAPSNLRIVLASRKGLELPLTDVRANGQYIAINTEQMRFTLQETAGILTRRFGARISMDDCVRLQEKIAGWPLGVQLALASIEKAPDLTASIDAMAAVTTDFGQYFLAHLVSRFDASSIEFLEEISILEALEPDLCRAATDRTDAPGRLASLREALPIFMEGVESDWLKLHPMAHDYLRGRLAQRDPAAIRVLHERAARWFVDHKMTEEAATHALAAGNAKHAFKLISDCLHDVMASGNQIRVLDWLDKIPEQEMKRYPRILLAAAWALGESERHVEAAALVARMEADPSATDADRLEGKLVGAVAAYFADQPGTAARILDPWHTAFFSAPPLQKAIFANARSTLLLYEGKPEQARQIIGLAHEHWPKSMDAVRGWGEWVVGFSYLWEGQVQLAIQALGTSLQRSEDALGRRAALSVMFASALAEALWDAGRVHDAADVLADRLDALERLASPESISMGYKVAARIASANGAGRRAFDLLDYLYALGESRQVPRLCITSMAEQIRIHALHGHAETCSLTSRRLDAIVLDWRDADEILLPVLKLRASIAQAYAAMATHDWKAMLAVLESSSAIAERLKRGRETIEIMLLTALAQHESGVDADRMVREAASIAAMFGFRATLLDTHPDLFNWFHIQQAGKAIAESRQQSSVSDSKLDAIEKPSLPRASALLTGKEKEILGLLEKNLSNKHIAAALGSSNDTVKWHIKNLFGKLNAGSRKHVVDRARMLGILSDPQ